MSEYKKGIFYPNYKFPMIDINSANVGKTGLTVAVEISDDDGVFSSSVGSVTELQSGWYMLNEVNSAEMNNGSLILVGAATGANDWRDVILPTEEVNITNSAAQLIWTIPFSMFEAQATARSPYYGMALLVNEFDFAGATLQIKKIDGSNLFTIITSGDANADLIVAGDTQ